MTPARLAAAGIALATLLAAWLRLHGLGAQVVLDDEWHPLHKLMTSDYRGILSSFGRADHSIPLTLLDKALASTVGLTEIRMRVLQVACGIALVPVVGLLVWRAMRNAPAAALAAIVVAGAPFLVLYSRVARPYAITTLCVVAFAALLWSWRTRRDAPRAAAMCSLAGLTAWLHPVSAVFPAVALVFVLYEDARARRALRPIVALGIGCAATIALLLALPIASDLRSLTFKSGGEHPDAFTLWRVLAIFAGGFPAFGTVVAAALALAGAWHLLRAQRPLGLYLLALFAGPILVIALVGADYAAFGHTFARYAMPAQVIFLAWAAIGGVALAARLAPFAHGRAQWLGAAALAAAYLGAGPAIRQVATLGPWYAHLYHHFDYSRRYNLVLRQFEGFPVPHFYRELAAMPPGSVLIAEAPFSYNAPGNPMAHFSELHRQPQVSALLHDTCTGESYEGEVPKDARFRFRNFVFLDDPAAVRARGVRYILLHTDLRQGLPFRQAARCVEALTRLYGEPVRREDELVVFAVEAAR